MVHARCRCPSRGLVAGATCGLRYQVTGRFASRDGTVMTVGATAGRDTCVIKLCASESHRCVTAPAAQLGLKMGRGFDHVTFG